MVCQDVKASRKNLKLNPEKSCYRKPEVSSVSHSLTSKGLRMQRTKGAGVINMVTPDKVAAVQQLFVMANHVSIFFKLADLASPLWQLTCKDNEWNWEAEQKKSIR